MSVSYGTNSCILDPVAMNHMTHSFQHFHSYTPSPSSRKIIVVNGLLATVVGYGDIYITSKLILKNILHVPKHSTSLISIKKLTYDLNSSWCVFQD